MARARTAASRAGRTASELQAAGAALAAHDWTSIAPGDTVTCYLAMAGEPPTSGVIAEIEARGSRVALPIMGPHRSLSWGWHADDVARNGYGVLQPPADTTFVLSQVDAIILPAQRVGRDGTRLGRGAGYYDRALENVPPRSRGGPLRIALVFDDEVDDSVPHDPWDQPVDVIVTPTMILRLPG